LPEGTSIVRWNVELDIASCAGPTGEEVGDGEGQQWRGSGWRSHLRDRDLRRSVLLLVYYWQQADAFWEYVWAIFPKAILWPAYMVYEGLSALGA
jgi:hypothetical protein